jgi:signal peptidase I
MKVFKGPILFIWDIAKIVIISLAIIVPIRAFIVQPFTVRGASMHPAFGSGDYLFINEIGYRFNDPQRGDVIIFRPPQNTSQFYIKRIIGIPGDTVKVEDGKIWLSNDASSFELLDEDYVVGLTPGKALKTLGSDEYFVLGDNRSASSDSRNWGAVSRKNVIGKAWIRAWPMGKFEVIKSPEY